MEERKIVKMFLVVGVLALVLNVYSIFVIDGISGKMFTDFVVPMMCMDDNDTYYLSTPTDHEFCDKILDNSIDPDEMVNLCADNYAGDEYESCIQMVGFYEKRTEDCMTYTFSLGKNKTTSVVPAEVEISCSVLVDGSQAQKSPTGLLMQGLFPGIKDRMIKG